MTSVRRFSCLTLLALLTLVAPASGQALRAGRGPETVARAYLDAWNRHDPATVCASVSDGLLRSKGLSRRSCRHAVTTALRGGAGGYRWVGFSYRIGAVRHYGGLASATISELHRFTGKHTAHRLRQLDRIWLQRVGRRWQIVKPGLLYAEIAAGAAVPADPVATDEPVTHKEAAAPARLPSLADCSTHGTVVGAGTLPSGDVGDLGRAHLTHAPWVDLTGYRLAIAADGSGCLALDTAAPLRPASKVEILLMQRLGDTFRVIQMRLRLTGLGHAHFSSSVHRIRFGLSATDRLAFRLPAHSLRLDWPTDVNVDLISTRPSEPFLAPQPDAQDALQATLAPVSRCCRAAGGSGVRGLRPGRPAAPAAGGRAP
jgi:hypothetical protein